MVNNIMRDHNYSLNMWERNAEPWHFNLSVFAQLGKRSRQPTCLNMAIPSEDRNEYQKPHPYTQPVTFPENSEKGYKEPVLAPSSPT